MVFLIKNLGNNKVGVFGFALPLLPFETKLLVGIRVSPLLFHTEVLLGLSLSHLPVGMPAPVQGYHTWEGELTTQTLPLTTLISNNGGKCNVFRN